MALKLVVGRNIYMCVRVILSAQQAAHRGCQAHSFTSLSFYFSIHLHFARQVLPRYLQKRSGLPTGLMHMLECMCINGWMGLWLHV